MPQDMLILCRRSLVTSLTQWDLAFELLHLSLFLIQAAGCSGLDSKLSAYSISLAYLIACLSVVGFPCKCSCRPMNGSIPVRNCCSKMSDVKGSIRYAWLNNLKTPLQNILQSSLVIVNETINSFPATRGSLIKPTFFIKAFFTSAKSAFVSLFRLI